MDKLANLAKDAAALIINADWTCTAVVPEEKPDEKFVPQNSLLVMAIATRLAKDDAFADEIIAWFIANGEAHNGPRYNA